MHRMLPRRWRPLLGTLLMLALFAPTLLAPSITHAQVIRASTTPYLRLGGGTSVSETDVATYAVEPYSFHGELGYQFTESLGVGLGLTYADYPKANFVNTTMATVQGLFRWTMFPKSRTSPYANVGPQLTLGGDNLAGGGVFGLGVDYVLTRRTSLFAEATAYATFPDDGIDSRDDGRAAFDGLGFWGAGIRATLEPAPTPVDLNPIEGPARVQRGEAARFTVRTNEDASAPIEYTWHFGDGKTAEGMVVEHAFPLEGTYTVEVRAENAGGTDRQTLAVRVDEPSKPARIIALDADTTAVQSYELVRLAADLGGTAPIDVQWDFGDRTAPVTERAAHRYSGDRYIGILETTLAQGYVYETPGTYTVTLTASNRFGTDEKTLRVRVEGERVVARRDPCRAGASPDTVFFAFDRSSLQEVSKQTLASKVEYLKQCPNLLVRLEGFADWLGPNAYNDRLSRRRAEAVKQFYTDEGIDASRFITRGNGELPPPCPDETKTKGCASFRRVETVIVVQETPIADAQNSAASSNTGNPSAAPAEQ